MAKVYFHVDVNSAFLSWSALKKLREGDTLDLRTVPSAVGGDEEKRHGVVLAKSGPAKAFGVRTGE
ncbi:DNA polymerase IV, partial [Gemmiger formicilis]|nr:DNA polymerase IV [Gemmiger formicilis]